MSETRGLEVTDWEAAALAHKDRPLASSFWPPARRNGYFLGNRDPIVFVHELCQRFRKCVAQFLTKEYLGFARWI